MTHTVILLCAPRSYSSVVGAMLGQHPQAYGMPELNLFLADRVDEWARLHQATRPTAMDGVLRALAQLHDGEQSDETVERARRWLGRRGYWSTLQLFAHLQEAVAPRVVVEKSPRTVSRMESLQRLRQALPDALFIHLTRHPVAMGDSLLRIMQRAKNEWGAAFDANKVDPERVWTHMNTLARDFARNVPEAQLLRVRGEDIMAEPRSYLAQIALWMELDDGDSAVEAMLHPETSPYACYGPQGARYGNDPNFLEAPQFRITEGNRPLPALDAPLPWDETRTLRADTRKLAREFGYDF